jgi:hypothetical protein
MELNQQEQDRVFKGEALAQLKSHKGWEILEQWLKDRAHHSWVNPRGMKKEDWEWAELNAYHSAEVAKQMLDDVEKSISDADYLRKKERGELKDKFGDIWKGIFNNEKKDSL